MVLIISSTERVTGTGEHPPGPSDLKLSSARTRATAKKIHDLNQKPPCPPKQKNQPRPNLERQPVIGYRGDEKYRNIANFQRKKKARKRIETGATGHLWNEIREWRPTQPRVRTWRISEKGSRREISGGKGVHPDRVGRIAEGGRSPSPEGGRKGHSKVCPSGASKGPEENSHNQERNSTNTGGTQPSHSL